MKRKIKQIHARLLFGALLILFQSSLYAGTSECIKLCDELYFSQSSQQQWKQCITDCIYTPSQHTGYTEKPEGYSAPESDEGSPCAHIADFEERAACRKIAREQLKKKCSTLSIDLKMSLYQRCSNGDQEACKRLASMDGKQN